MLNFEYQNPTKVLFGTDSLQKLGKEILCFGDTALLVYGGGSVKTNGNYEKIVTPLKEAGIQWIDFGGNKTPDIYAVSKGVDLCREHGIDVIIGIGGGCCMDLAKGIGRCAKFEKSVPDCLEDEAVITSSDSLPVFEIVTNPSSGSEYDQWCELTDSSRGKSYGLEHAWPEVTILCPELSYSLDAKQTAYGAATALVQLMASYVAKVEDSDFSTAMLEGMVRVMIASIPIAIKEPENYAARSNIMWCVAYATGGAAGCGKYIEWSSSPLAEMLEKVAGLTYQEAMTIVYPYWLEKVFSANTTLFAGMAVRVWNVPPGW